MASATEKSSEITYRIWGALDALFLAWYAVSAMTQGRRPFIDDLNLIATNLSYNANIDVAIMTGIYLLLVASLIISSSLLLTVHPLAKMICYIQVPFRLLTVLPSISLISILASFFQINAAVLIGAVISSEAIKVWTLMRWAK